MTPVQEREEEKGGMKDREGEHKMACSLLQNIQIPFDMGFASVNSGIDRCSPRWLKNDDDDDETTP